jgi:sugar fermentation stimulation protein A
MKFKQALTEATLLKRQFRFLAEIALQDRRKRLIYCPNLNLLPQCDILGSRIWLSSPSCSSTECLDIWELTEVNGGWLVCINATYTDLLVREAIELGRIPELQGFQYWQTPLLPTLGIGIELLMDQKAQQCFVHFETVLSGDDKNNGYFPHQKSEGIEALQALINLKESGYRAMLFYCIQHNGVYALKTNDVVDENYGKLLRAAFLKGVEIIAYRLSIRPDELVLTTKVPVLLSESAIFH